MYLGSSPSPHDALQRLRTSGYSAAFMATDPFSEFWLHDLRHHTALALIMARASAATMSPAALTRRGLCDLAMMSMSGVHALLADACARGDFRRDADAGDRRRVMLMPTEETTATFSILVHHFLVAANGEPLPHAVVGAAVQEPQILSLYARFACALVGSRRPGGRLWLEPASLALLSDLMTGGRDGLSQETIKASATRRGQRGTVDGDIAFAAMAGLVESGPEGRIRLSGEGRTCMLDHLEIWRSWSSEARLALANLSLPMSSRAA